ncbi:DUF2339 domain-containing protein, partial [Thiococcus pfennigii]|uniref:DUF2339 domain-containing protein n=1 Tax=Thiococcus pfennigii TaxID=1057 RepID=UPI003B8473C0
MLWWLLGLALLVLVLGRADAPAFALWAILAALVWRLAQLEARLADLRRRLAEGPAPVPVPVPVPVPAAPGATAPPLELDADLVASLAPSPDPSRQAATPDWLRRGLETLRRFFTEGNAPVKIGLLVLLAGIGALLDYAADQDWLRFPPAWRLLALAAVAAAGLGLGWHQRRRRPVFALALQGGAIGALYLILFAALRLYELVGTGAAFAGFVALAVLGLGLAVRQSAQPVAAFAVLGGLAAPLLASTGSGSHVALFGFYAVLNAVVFAAAWWRAWRVLNLIGFVATFIVGLAWGHSYYAPAHFATVEPFLVLFFLFYVAVGLLYARHRPTPRGWWVDATLVFGTPLLAFGLQVALLAGADRPLAWSAAAVALL